MKSGFGRKGKSDVTGQALGEYEGFEVEEMIGKTVKCMDGHERRVVEVVHSHRYNDRAIINENDPDSNAGHFVHYLDKAAVAKGLP